jgi:hypothetical protein
MVLLQIDMNEFVDSVGGIGWMILIILISLLIMVLALKIGINAVKGINTEMGSVFITGFISWLIIVILTFLLPLFGWLIGLFIALFIIMKRHDTTFFGALGAIIIAFIVLVIFVFLIFFILGANFLDLLN